MPVSTEGSASIEAPSRPRPERMILRGSPLSSSGEWYAPGTVYLYETKYGEVGVRVQSGWIIAAYNTTTGQWWDARPKAPRRWWEFWK